MLNIVFLFIASFTDRVLGCQERSELARVSLHCKEFGNKVLYDRRDSRSKKNEIKMLRFKTESVTGTVYKAFVSRYSWSLSFSKCYALESLTEKSKRFGTISFTDARSFQYFDVFTKQSHRVTC